MLAGTWMTRVCPIFMPSIASSQPGIIAGGLALNFIATGLRPGPSDESYICPLERNDLYLIFTMSPACGVHGLKGEHVSAVTLSKNFTPPGVTPTDAALTLTSPLSAAVAGLTARTPAAAAAAVASALRRVLTGRAAGTRDATTERQHRMSKVRNIFLSRDCQVPDSQTKRRSKRRVIGKTPASAPDLHACNR
eukprot:scaffold41322_cov60-Phaeocystis_antarctica.AAC.2